MIPNKIINPLVVVMIFMHNQECTHNIILQDGCEWLPNVFQLWLCPTLPRDALCLGPVQSQEGSNVPIIFNFF